MTALPTPSSPMSRLGQKVGAEMVGTFALVFAGCGAVAVNELSSGVLGHVGIALTFGLVIMVMIYATGHISGAHFNPAVTLAFASTGRFPWSEVPAYVGGQLVAASVAAYALAAVFGPEANLGLTLPAGTAAQSLVLEIVMTFFLMFVIAAVATDSRAKGQAAGLAIGSTVALAALFGGPISGASLNPARSFGPALAAGNFEHLWLYAVAPVLGALLGAFVYRAIRCGGEVQDARGCC